MKNIVEGDCIYTKRFKYTDLLPSYGKFLYQKLRQEYLSAYPGNVSFSNTDLLEFYLGKPGVEASVESSSKPRGLQRFGLR